MTAIIAAIDAYMTANFGQYTHTFFGFCELANRSNGDGAVQPIPVTITGTHKRTQVSLDDKMQLVTWIRLINTGNGNEIDGNDWDFGVDDNSVQTASLLMFVAHKVELGENLIHEIVAGLPGIFTVSGYRIVSLDRGLLAIDADHESIYNSELGTGVYERHRFPWNLYSVSLNIEFIPNAVCV